MDFERIKQNLRFRSGRAPTNMSKKFPTREVEKVEAPRAMPQIQQAKQVLRQKPKATKTDSTKPMDSNAQPRAPSNIPPREKSIFKEKQQELAIRKTRISESDSGEADFDLRPAPSKPKYSKSLEHLSDLLFSEGYLKALISDPQLLVRFTAFLSRYKPEISGLLLQYLETQKVIKAVHYANAVANSLEHSSSEFQVRDTPAAELSPSFQKSSQRAFDTLLNTALPAWITYSLVKTSTSCLTSEITNQSTPLTQDLVGGLSEVFCLTDPTRKDNPIIYASEEFYRLTGYGKDAVIGYNCRFLQGSKTKRQSVQRLKTAINKGEEISETLLNYRRDGKPFINVLMLAPLHDDKGNVKYYLGAQVDASRLVEGGRVVDGFERFLLKEETESRRDDGEETDPKQIALAKLRDLSLSFDLEESAVVQTNSRRNSISSNGGDEKSNVSDRRQGRRRRFLDFDVGPESDSNDSDEEGMDEHDRKWKLSHDKKSGKLPGIYKKYLLIRPYPSLRTIFVSQEARKLGQLQQHPFLAHVAAPSSTLFGLKESFQFSTPVTAKISMMQQAGKNTDGFTTGRWGKKGSNDPAKHGKTCWISATPLMDDSDKVGVWMIVIVDEGSIASNTGRSLETMLDQTSRTAGRENDGQLTKTSDLKKSDLPIKPKAVGVIDDGLMTPIKDDQQFSIEDDEAIPEVASHFKSHRIELPNGSQTHQSDQNSIRSNNIEVGGDAKSTSKPSRGRGSQISGDVGLRAMDYLSSRSPTQTKQSNGISSEKNHEAVQEWNVASPYSVD